ncbi:SIR2 family protein [Xanthomonas campestris pv. raphani]|nr:SIR2 family protein [Xanthomonas campestris]MEA9773459.1 SIR2 family protein [Xanthomonas campestris pv. raphani]MEA9801666.1 SIR2 family protein [Xanthomonas campestris pv. raphani]MEA9833583.1 SIR2 family protein [Xanthomonas campestris pv. raphani]MEA9951112.1 SIR2 family protein [Xanthomonas campestris pv. raphani]MEA9955091.1 SIR2 family protein [Xanthomonas campestris pv. raphani]
MDYQSYQQEVAADIEAILREYSCQPIVFIGSGLSRRYANAPNWEELLKKLAADCPVIDKEFAYYKQTYGNNFIKIGSVFADFYHQWAWSAGRNNFPEEYFSEKYPREIFIKHAASEILRSLELAPKGKGQAEIAAEIVALKAMSPHSIITTNYDQLLEPLFEGYEAVVGQQVIKKGYLSIGEIFKIHGCISDPLSLVLTEEDYFRFSSDHKYLSAKLLTYFIEHPLLFIGYNAEDPNVKMVLYDVHRMLRDNFDLVPNMYILEWDPTINEGSYPVRDKVLSVADGVNIRIKSISASSFGWVFRAFGVAGNLEKVDTKLLRALMARAVGLIRSDAPKRTVEIDFQTLEHAVESGDSFAKLFGLTTISDPSQVNLNYLYTLTGVAEQLGYSYWSKANDLIKELKKQTGFDMKGADNVYHICMRTGNAAASKTNKYSQKAVDLLKKLRDGEKYRIETTTVKVDKSLV